MKRREWEDSPCQGLKIYDQDEPACLLGRQLPSGYAGMILPGGSQSLRLHPPLVRLQVEGLHRGQHLPVHLSTNHR